MIRLPVSGVQLEWRETNGDDDIALADSAPGLPGARNVVAQGAVDAEGRPADAGALPVGDLDRLIVERRRELIGDSLLVEGRCARCGERVDLRFSLRAFVHHYRPTVPRGTVPSEEDPGWWRFSDGHFRVPSVDDVLAAAQASDPRSELLDRCWHGAATRARAAERAIGLLGPTLRGDMSGACPECAESTLLDVDARELCLAELRREASTVYADVHWLASAYGWHPAEILGLPTARRRRFALSVAGQTVHDWSVLNG